MHDEIYHVMHYLYLKGWSKEAARKEIYATYKTSYPSPSTAKRMFKEFKNPEIKLTEIHHIDSPKKQKRIEAIQSVLNNNPNPSVRLVAEQTYIPTTTVWRTLVSDMGLKFQVPILAPHDLNSEIKQKRVEKCYELLRVLEDPKLKPHKIITGDESWLQWKGRVRGRWQSKEESPPFSPRISQTIKKTMIIVFFSFKKILVSDFLSNGVKNNSRHMCEYIWPAIDQELKKLRPTSGAKGFFLHFDNSPVHKSQESMEKIKDLGFILLENPPYSPDIAPSDFCLFGFLNEKRKGTVSLNEEDLILQTKEILSKIDSTLLGTVFKEWIKRLHMVIESQGEYLLN